MFRQQRDAKSKSTLRTGSAVCMALRIGDAVVPRSISSPPLPENRKTALLSRHDVVGADYIAPALDLALQQSTRGLGRFFIRRVFVHATLRIGLAHVGIGERSAQRGVELIDDRPWCAGRCQQHVPEIDIKVLVAELAQRLPLWEARE